MANVLGTLFGDIADAIRAKSGESGTMKPAEFPEKISGISAGTSAEILENIPIALDFSGGNQTITAQDGTLVKSAIIQKPDTLTPENIAQGVNIAGIIGALAGGGGSGGSGEVTMKSGSFTAGSTYYPSKGATISHNMGVVPDLIFVYKVGVPANMTISFAIGFSSKISNRLSTKSGGIVSAYFAASGMIFLDKTGSCETSDDNCQFGTGYGTIRSVNENTFIVGGTTNTLESGASYAWRAYAGIV